MKVDALMATAMASVEVEGPPACFNEVESRAGGSSLPVPSATGDTSRPAGLLLMHNDATISSGQ